MGRGIVAEHEIGEVMGAIRVCVGHYEDPGIYSELGEAQGGSEQRETGADLGYNRTTPAAGLKRVET